MGIWLRSLAWGIMRRTANAVLGATPAMRTQLLTDPFFRKRENRKQQGFLYAPPCCRHRFGCEESLLARKHVHQVETSCADKQHDCHVREGHQHNRRKPTQRVVWLTTSRSLTLLLGNSCLNCSPALSAAAKV